MPGSPCWLGELSHDRRRLLSPSLDCRGVARGPALPPVPLPGLRGGHNGVYGAWCHPPPVFSKLQWQEGTGSHQQREVGIDAQATCGLIKPFKSSLPDPPSFSEMLPSFSQETWGGWEWVLEDQVPPLSFCSPQFWPSLRVHKGWEERGPFTSTPNFVSFLCAEAPSYTAHPQCLWIF